MPSASWLRAVKSVLNSYDRSRRQRLVWQRLSLEALEDRVVPANISWNVNHDGFWDVASNWSTGTVPVAGDDVTINQAGPLTVTIQDSRAFNSIHTSGTDALSLTNGSVTIAAASQLNGAYLQSDGTLTATAGLTLTSAASKWSNGTFVGSVTNQGTLTLGPGVGHRPGQNLTGTLTNAGNIIDLNDPAVSVGLILSSGTVNNQVGGLLDFQTDLGVTGTGAVNNAGTVRKSVGTGTTTIQVALSNAAGGILEADTGTLQLEGGGTSTGGTFNVKQNATLVLNADATLNGTYTGSGAGSVQLLAGTIQVASGTDTTFNFPTGLFEWQNGTIAAGTGKFTNTGFITLGPGFHNASETLTGTLANAGTITAVNGSVDSGFGLELDGSGILNNLATGLLDFQTDLGVSPTFNGTGVINNAGTIRKSASFGITPILIPLNNAAAGIIEVDTGTLQFLGGGTSTGGTFIARQNAVLLLATDHSATPTYNGTYTGSGAGSVQVQGGTVQVANGADTTFNFSAGLFSWSGGTIAVGTGTFTNAGFVTLNSAGIQTLTGTLTNAGTITDRNTRRGLGLNLASTGILNNLATGLFDIQTDSDVMSSDGSGVFNNAGTIKKSAGTGFRTTIAVLLNSTATGIEVDAGILAIGGGGAFTGGNFLVKQNASLVLNSTNANLTLNGTYTSSGTGSVLLTGGSLLVAQGADTTFNFPAGVFVWSNGRITSGTGHFTNNGAITIGPEPFPAAFESLTGTLANSGTITSLSTSSSGGFILFSGTLNNLLAGVVDFQTDSFVYGYATLADPGNAGALNNSGTLRKSAGSGTTEIKVALDNSGTVEAASGTLSVTGTVAQVSGATLGGGTWVADSGSSLDLHSILTTNKATVTLDGAGATSPLRNLDTNAGIFKVLNGATFTTLTGFPAFGDLTNSGTITVGGTLTVSGKYTQTALGTLGVQVGGTPASGQFGKLNVTGQSALAGTLAIGLVNGFGPSGGQTYPIITYAGHTGDFTTVTGLGIFFSKTTNPTGVVLRAYPNNP